MAVNFEKLWQDGYFPRTEKLIREIAIIAKEGWSQATLSASPSWWGKMALSKTSGGGGGFILRKVPGGYEVSYANQGKYNYLAVIEKGRGPFDMKPSILASKRARMGKNGRYTIVPLSKGNGGEKISPSNSNINGLMTKIGSRKEPNADGQTVTRNRYSYSRDQGMSGKGNIYETRQHQKDGSIQSSYTKFITVSESSNGFIYPAIKAQNNQAKIEAVVNKALASNSLKTAIAKDMNGIISHLVKKYGSK